VGSGNKDINGVYQPLNFTKIIFNNWKRWGITAGLNFE